MKNDAFIRRAIIALESIWDKRRPMPTRLGCSTEDAIGTMLGAIEFIGKRQLFDVRERAISNGTVETISNEMEILGGTFKGTYSFDGRGMA